MNRGGATRTGIVRPVGLAARLGCLLLVVVVVYAIMAPAAYYFHGAAGVWAASLSTGVCLAGSIVALLAADRFSGPDHALVGVLGAMLVRMGVPLAFCVVVYVRGGQLVAAGALIYLLVVYLATLAVETWMALGQVGHAAGQLTDAPAKARER